MKSDYPNIRQIVTALKNPKNSYKNQILFGGSIISSKSRVIYFAGGYSVVFPFKSKSGNIVALKIWFANIGNVEKKYNEITKRLESINYRYFVRFQFKKNAILINGRLYPILIMDWIGGKSLKEYINENISNSAKIKTLAAKFMKMVAFLHKQKIAHGDLQHGNILVKPDGNLVLIDYDSMFVPSLNGIQDVIKGIPAYQHPKRMRNSHIHHKLDYFSELVIYFSIQVFAYHPELWSKYSVAEELLFSKQDLHEPENSTLIGKLLFSKNNQISSLASELKNELKKKDIDTLIPLEQIMNKVREDNKNLIIQKWKNPPLNRKTIKITRSKS